LGGGELLAFEAYEGVFGWAVAFGKAVVGYDFLKSSFTKVPVSNPKVRLVHTGGFWKSFSMTSGPHMSCKHLSPSS
jgi:hypothetical protein